MKTIQYLSPTSISLWRSNPDEFYLMYLAENRPPKIPQSAAMAVGSAFDAFIKSYLHEAIFGKGKDSRFQLQTLFEAQVESHNRDAAWAAGKNCFETYKRLGCVSDLMMHLDSAIGEPRFELEIKGVVNGYREGVTLTKKGVTLLGKPDIFFINSYGAHVILDWKVNGYCSQYGASPAPGYVNIRGDARKSGHHDDCLLLKAHQGILINAGSYLEQIKEDWAHQLSIYGWLCGIEIGQEFIAAIDQLACRHGNIRIAHHRSRISSTYQWNNFAQIQQLWEIVHSNHIFRDMSLEDSEKRCLVLEEQAKALSINENERDDWFRKITRF